MQREVKRAVRRSGIRKRATYHTFRHSFATEALRGGCDIRKLRHVIGHKDVRTTTIYLHVVEQTGLVIRPLDRPDDLADYDVDPVGTPWAGVDEPWDLGLASGGQYDIGERLRRSEAPLDSGRRRRPRSSGCVPGDARTISDRLDAASTACGARIGRASCRERV